MRAPALLLLLLACPTLATEVEFQAFGLPVRIEVLDLDPAAARRALVAATLAIHESEARSDPDVGALGQLNELAGQGPATLPAELTGALTRALQFCEWSEGAWGPLAGHLNRLWGTRGTPSHLPSPAEILTATEAASCDRLTLGADGTVGLEAGSRLDLWGMEQGLAVDAAVEPLAAEGSKNFWVQVGDVVRAEGLGHDGEGWRAELSGFRALDRQPAVRLHGQALAIAHVDRPLLAIGGERVAPYVGHREGRPARGIVAVIAVTELATDAQALATTLFATGSAAGERLLGGLRPSPSIRWFVGGELGEPLITDHHWSRVSRP